MKDFKERLKTNSNLIEMSKLLKLTESQETQLLDELESASTEFVGKEINLEVINSKFYEVIEKFVYSLPQRKELEKSGIEF